MRVFELFVAKMWGWLATKAATNEKQAKKWRYGKI
jgi:hypothetical protein